MFKGASKCSFVRDDSDHVAKMQTRYEYDGAGNLTRRATMASAGSTSAISTSTDMVVDYNYADVNGLLVDQTLYYASGTTAVTYYSYDGIGRQTQVEDPDGNLTKSTYNGTNQVTRRQQVEDDPIASDDLTITTDYFYDSLTENGVRS